MTRNVHGGNAVQKGGIPMSKKLVCLALVLVMVMAVAIAETPSSIAYPTVSGTKGDVTVTVVEPEVAKKTYDSVMDAVVALAKGEATLPDVAQTALTKLNVEVEKLDLEAVVAAEAPVKLEVGEQGGTVKTAKPAGLTEYVTAFGFEDFGMYPVEHEEDANGDVDLKVDPEDKDLMDLINTLPALILFVPLK